MRNYPGCKELKVFLLMSFFLFVVEESKPTPQSGVGIKSLEQIRQEKADKLQKLQEALQPKTLDDIRRERAVKRGSESIGEFFISYSGLSRDVVNCVFDTIYVANFEKG